MKITQSTGVLYWEVRTDADDATLYRRSQEGQWIKHIGDAWVPAYDEEDVLERAWVTYLVDKYTAAPNRESTC